MSTLDDILKKRDEVPENVARGRAVHAPQPVPPAATQRQTENVPPVPTSEPKQFSYAELFKQLNTNPQPSKEELEKERRREKQRAVISAIGDGLSALANMHYTKRDAVNLYDNGSSLSDRNRERYKALVDERKRRVDAYNAGLEKAVSLDYNNALKQAALKYQQEQDAQRQANWEKEFDQGEKKIAADKKAAEDKAAEERKYREHVLENDRKRIAIAQQNADNASNNITQGFRSYDKDGIAHYFDTKEKAIWFARQEGTLVENPVEEVTVITENDGYSLPKTKTSTKTSTKVSYSKNPREKVRGGSNDAGIINSNNAGII